MTSPAYTEAVRLALKRVALTPDEVEKVLGSCLEGEAVYLVGSLAAGLGNAESDVDLHVFVAEPAAGLVPMLFFAGRTRLDVVHHALAAPAATLAKTPTRSAPLLAGRCALGALPDMTDLKRLSRWATAVPVHEGTALLFSDPDRERVAAALARQALDATVRAAALARLLEIAEQPHAAIAWSRAAEAALEVATRLAGDLFIGDKWLIVKALRSGFGPERLRAARRVACSSDFDAFVRDLGLPIDAPERLVRLEAVEARSFRFGERTFRLVEERLVPPLAIPSDSLDETIGALGAAALREAVASRALSLALDMDGVDRRLGCA